MEKKLFKRLSTILVSLTIMLSLFPKIAFAGTTSYAESYDPRDLGVMTPVKNQSTLEVCWSFAGIGATESYLKSHGYGEWDFSEEHARWWATYNEAGYGWNKTSREGGPTQIMPGYLTSWQGLKEEKDIPLTTNYYSVKPVNMDSAASKYNVTDIVYVNNNSLSVKDAIFNCGAVSTSYYNSWMYFNSNNTAYYCNDKNNIANHNVIIVGWNDNYSKENFKNGARPVNDGAWLIKNDWGDNNSEGGYIWISYEDNFILSQSANKINYAIKGVEEVNKNKKMYQYDEYGATSSLYLNNDSGKVQDMTYANVYDFDSEHEILDEIMFNSVITGAKYALYYAPIVNNKPELTVDKMLPLGSGTIEDPGYITVDINDFVLPKGKGAIVVYLDNRQNNSPVSLGCEVNLTYAGGRLAYKADASLGESYIYSDQEVLDLNEVFTDTPRSLSIKAITKKSSDASLGLVEVNGTNITSTLNKDNYTMELPYSSINSKAKIKVNASNQNARINSINSEVKAVNIAEEEVAIPEGGQVSPIEITCEAADGSVKAYTLNITVAKDIKTADDIIKCVEIMDNDNTSDIINLNKNFDNLSTIEKEKLSDEVISKIMKQREVMASEFHEENGIKVSGIPWQVNLNVTSLVEDEPSYINIKNMAGKDKILASYEISLIDQYTKLSYNCSDDEVMLTIPSSILKGYENIRILHLKSNGETEYLTPTIEGDKLIIKVTSFSPYAIIGQEKLKISNGTDDNINNIVDVSNDKMGTDINSVKSGDNSATIVYVVLGIVSLSVAIFTIINLLKNKNKNKNKKK